MMRHPVSSLLLGFLVAILLASTTADAQDGWVPDKFRRLFSHACGFHFPRVGGTMGLLIRAYFNLQQSSSMTLST